MNLDFSDIKVLVIGDFMIDHYIMGTSNRMSPEANVPVVIPKDEYSIPGGAGNVAINLSAMGANVVCLGLVGDDIWGELLLSNLKNSENTIIDGGGTGSVVTFNNVIFRGSYYYVIFKN